MPLFTRRAVLGGALLVASASALAACADSSATGSEAQGSNAPDGASGSPATAGSFPVTIETAFGSATINSSPERVVVVGLTEQDILLQLGVVPVATTEWYGDQPDAVWPWAHDLLGGAQPEVLSTADGFQFEKIAALGPDLIIGANAGMTQSDYDTLSKIAPTVAQPAGATEYFSDWDALTVLVAKALGREAEGRAIVDGVQAAYAAAAAAHPDFAGKVASFSQNALSDGVLYVYPPDVNTQFLTMLGFTISPALTPLAPGPGQQAQLSTEQLGLIDTDVLVVAAEKPEDIANLMAVPTFARLGVVSGQRTVYTDATLAGALYFMTPLSLQYALDRLVPQLQAAVGGQAPAEVLSTPGS